MSLGPSCMMGELKRRRYVWNCALFQLLCENSWKLDQFQWLRLALLMVEVVHPRKFSKNQNICFNRSCYLASYAYPFSLSFGMGQSSVMYRCQYSFQLIMGFDQIFRYTGISKIGDSAMEQPSNPVLSTSGLKTTANRLDRRVDNLTR